MLYGVDQYYYSYFLRSNKVESCTEIGVYTIQKEFSNNLLQVCRSFGLEVYWILPLNNLIDVGYKLENIPDNELHIRIEPDCAKLFVYRQGFLIDCSTISNPTDAAFRNSMEHFRQFIDLINQRVRALHMANREIRKISVNPEYRFLVKVNDNLILELIDEKQENISLPIVNSQSLLTTYLANNLQRINLLKSSFPLMKELKKNKKKVVITVCILAASLVVYLVSFGYSLYQNNLILKKKDREYTNLVKRYLPKGASKSNAVLILRERVRDVKERWNHNKKYRIRKYPYINLLQKISLMKNHVASLHVDKIQSSEKSTAISGNVTSMQDFDQYLEQIAKTFPENEFETRNKHNTQGANLVTFTTTIRPKRNFR